MSGQTSDDFIRQFRELEDEQMRLMSTEGLIKSGISRRIGFPFMVELTHERIIIIDSLNQSNKTYVMLNDGVIDEDVVKRLVAACIRLKKKHDKGVK